MHKLVPHPARITHIHTETPDTKTFRVVNTDGTPPFDHLPGQCAMLGIPGVGEAMFSIASPPNNKYFDFSIKAVGTLTFYLHSLQPETPLTLRGPYGTPFPVTSALKDKDLIFIAGGIGIAPLRSVIKYVFNHRKDYGTVDIIYGTRSSADLVYLKEIQGEWVNEPGTRVYLTIDKPEDNWFGHVGFVPSYITRLAPDPLNKTVLLCGPPVMIRYAVETLLTLGFTKAQIYTTLEMRMKCGIGKCGRCNIGHKYVCLDGPVFRCDELEELPGEY
jgi:NAD(P)H-flavin reductase